MKKAILAKVIEVSVEHGLTESFVDGMMCNRHKEVIAGYEKNKAS